MGEGKRLLTYEDTTFYEGIEKVRVEIELASDAGIGGYREAFKTILKVATFCEGNIRELFGEEDEDEKD